MHSNHHINQTKKIILLSSISVFSIFYYGQSLKTVVHLKRQTNFKAARPSCTLQIQTIDGITGQYAK